MYMHTYTFLDPWVDVPSAHITYTLPISEDGTSLERVLGFSLEVPPSTFSCLLKSPFFSQSDDLYISLSLSLSFSRLRFFPLAHHRDMSLTHKPSLLLVCPLLLTYQHRSKRDIYTEFHVGNVDVEGGRAQRKSRKRDGAREWRLKGYIGGVCSGR